MSGNADSERRGVSLLEPTGAPQQSYDKAPEWAEHELGPQPGSDAGGIPVSRPTGLKPPMKFIYIAGPYMGKARLHNHLEYFEIDANINRAAEVAARLAREGIGFFCPHTHSAHFEVIVPEVQPKYWYEADLHFLKACDAIYLLPGWHGSSGSKLELAFAEDNFIRVFFTDQLEEMIEWAKGQPQLLS